MYVLNIATLFFFVCTGIKNTGKIRKFGVFYGSSMTEKPSASGGLCPRPPTRGSATGPHWGS